MKLFDELTRIHARPEPFEFYTAKELWTDEHTSGQMLCFHLDEEIDVSSRNAAFIDRSVAWIRSRFNVGPETRVADFGCGPGLYAARLARMGAEVTGIDFSRRSIQHARAVAERDRLSIRYLQEDYLDFETDARFDLILMIMCDFCALSLSQRSGLLERFSEILTPGGSVLLDVYSLRAFDQRDETDICEPNLLNGFWSPHPYFGFLNTFKYFQENVVLDKYTIVEVDRSKVVYNWLQYFSAEGLENEFSAAGFAVEGFYSDVAGAPYDPQSGEFAIVARKP